MNSIVLTLVSKIIVSLDPKLSAQVDLLIAALGQPSSIDTSKLEAASAGNIAATAALADTVATNQPQ